MRWRISLMVLFKRLNQLNNTIVLNTNLIVKHQAQLRSSENINIFEKSKQSYFGHFYTHRSFHVCGIPIMTTKYTF